MGRWPKAYTKRRRFIGSTVGDFGRERGIWFKGREMSARLIATSAGASARPFAVVFGKSSWLLWASHASVIDRLSRSRNLQQKYRDGCDELA